jgi:hypothetical protein
MVRRSTSATAATLESRPPSTSPRSTREIHRDTVPNRSPWTDKGSARPLTDQAARARLARAPRCRSLRDSALLAWAGRSQHPTVAPTFVTAGERDRDVRRPERASNAPDRILGDGAMGSRSWREALDVNWPAPCAPRPPAGQLLSRQARSRLLRRRTSSDLRATSGRGSPLYPNGERVRWPLPLAYFLT